MNIQPNNNLAFTSGPVLDQASFNVPQNRSEANNSFDMKDSGRTRASRLAETSTNSRLTESSELNDRFKGLNLIESGWNGIKKLGRSLCLAGGWASASAAIVSILFLNIKILGIIFGVPAFLFLYTASTLGRDIKLDPMKVATKDPLNNLKQILEHNPQILRDDPKFVIRTIQAIGDMKKNSPRYYDVLDRVEALRDTILMEKAQLRKKEDQESLLYKEVMDDYLGEIAKATSLRDLHGNHNLLTHS